jgi:hypothetical protein
MIEAALERSSTVASMATWELSLVNEKKKQYSRKSGRKDDQVRHEADDGFIERKHAMADTKC